MKKAALIFVFIWCAFIISGWHS